MNAAKQTHLVKWKAYNKWKCVNHWKLFAHAVKHEDGSERMEEDGVREFFFIFIDERLSMKGRSYMKIMTMI